MPPTDMPSRIQSRWIAILSAIFLAGALLPLSQAQSSYAKALTFHASFNDGVDADRAEGDARLYTRTTRDQNGPVQAGLHAEGATRIAKGKGVSGDCLEFTAKASPWVCYKAAGNVGYAPEDWSGSVSVWLKLDPEEDLEPGYCDPIQITPKAWNNAAFFIDFDKAGDPRDFRLGAFADLSVWKPADRSVNDIPEDERPLLKVHSPPFSRESWTHVVFTWERFNTGKPDGVARFYLNGEHRGDITGWTQTFTWSPNDESRLWIGINYIGLFDELACFNRPLTAAEVKALYQNQGRL